MKKLITLLIVGLLVAAPLAAAAAPVERNETVYVTLDNHGQAEDVRVVTWLRGDPGEATWTDYGQYESVESSVSDVAPSIGEGTLTWPASSLQGEGLFYQGTTKAELPFGLRIAYSLNGQTVEPEALAGESGEVEIKFSVTNRLRQERVIGYRDYAGQLARRTATVYTPLMVQVTQALPVGVWDEIAAAGATRVLAGDQLRLSWALFPYPEADFTLKMHGQKISLAPLEISVLPMMPPLPDLDFAGQLTELLAGVDQLSGSLTQLATAAGQLSHGQAEAVAGGQQLSAGLSELVQAAQAAEGGATSLATGLSGLQTSHQQLAQAATRLQQSGDPYLQSIADGLVAEAEALAGLAAGGQSLAGGLNQLGAAIGTLSQQLGALFSGVEQITAGQEALTSGLQAVLLQGIKPMREQALRQYGEAKLGVATTTAMQQLVSEHHSFIDNSRNRVGQVQYLLRTQGVQLPAVAQVTPPAPVRLSLWQRIVRFFTGK